MKSNLIKRFGLLLLALLLGGILGFLAAQAIFNGWMTRWKAIPPPPEKAEQILLSFGDHLWVRAGSGAVYFNVDTAGCEQDCWSKVDSAPAEVPLPPGVRERRDRTCVTPPPLLFFSAVQQAQECQVEQWTDYNSVYALDANGNLITWHSTTGGEYSALGYLFLICVGSVGLFVMTLVGILIKAVVDRRKVPS